MMLRANAHTHTRFCDGENTVEEMASAACAQGFVALGFSGHAPMRLKNDFAMDQTRLAAYRAAVLEAKQRYCGRLAVFLGLEWDETSVPVSEPYDYLLGAVHAVQGNDGAHYWVDESREALARAIRQGFGGDALALAEAYYARVAALSQRHSFAALAHLDLLTKFNETGEFFEETAPRYRKAALDALDVALKRDVLIEVNTGAMARGWRTAPYPAPFLLRRVREKGGRVVIGSDAHRADALTAGFAQAQQLLREIGFQEVYALDANGGFSPVAL